MIWVATWLTRSMSPQWVMVSSVLNEACAIFSRSDSLCILMTLTEWLLPDGGRQKPLESEQDKDLPPSAPLLISVIFINILPPNELTETKSSYRWAGGDGFIPNYLLRPLRRCSGDWMYLICSDMMSKHHIQGYSLCIWRMICRGCKHPYSCMQFLRVNRWFSWMRGKYQPVCRAVREAFMQNWHAMYYRAEKLNKIQISIKTTTWQPIRLQRGAAVCAAPVVSLQV